MIKAKNKTGLVFFPAFDWAISPDHPEREERLLYTRDQLFEEGIEDIKGITFFNPVLAEVKDIERVHFCVPSVKARLTESHYISAGGAIRGFQAVMNKEVDNAFALVRPPGHHANRVVYGSRGFCLINIEAVMLERIRQEFGHFRAAIIDTDCHHGDGTQDIYWNDPDTLFISFHQDGRTLYPGTGFIEEFGGPGAYGCNINIPLPPETGEEGFLYVLDHVVMPILDDFKPDVIINSAGQDNHYTDPLTRMKFTARGYAKLTEKLNPQMAVLEGGYSIEGALPYMNLGIILALAGIDYSHVVEPDYYDLDLSQSDEVTDYIKELADTVYHRWEIREYLKEKEFRGLEQFTRNRRIYYDTDGILEQQKETIQHCSRCSGLVVIDSKNDKGISILAITIPRDACKKCVKEGQKLFKNPPAGYHHYYLQDRINDEFFSK